MFKILEVNEAFVNYKNQIIDDMEYGQFPIYIMGRNSYSEFILTDFNNRQIVVKGIIDDFTKDEKFKNKSIYKTKEIEKESIVITCVIEAKLITSIKHLREYGISKILTYFDFVLLDNYKYPNMKFCQDNLQDITENYSKYEWLYSVLDDNLSRETLEAVTNFRVHFDPSFIEKFSYRLDSQYFDIINTLETNYFVDCGSYDGKTSVDYIKSNPNYKSIVAFEPSPHSYLRVKEELNNYPNTIVYPYATANYSGTQLFDDSFGNASSLSSNGKISVRVVKLDNIISNKVDLIKMDVEGAEFETLEGAEHLIKLYKPNLAVCVYHNQKDFWRIPQLVLSYNPDYKVVLRHYTEGILETVIYFVSK